MHGFPTGHICDIDCWKELEVTFEIIDTGFSYNSFSNSLNVQYYCHSANINIQHPSYWWWWWRRWFISGLVTVGR